MSSESKKSVLRFPSKEAFEDAVRAASSATVERVTEILGGWDAYQAAYREESAAMELRWVQDVELIGRLLRAHLYVEHYLTAYLVRQSPALVTFEEARLSFAQKVALLEGTEAGKNGLAKGIRHLNKIRNRLAHNLSVEVTRDDAAVFMEYENFAARARDHWAREAVPLPIDVLEAFAKHAALAMSETSDSFRNALGRAWEEFGSPEYFGRMEAKKTP